jgi:hypothetical protein
MHPETKHGSVEDKPRDDTGRIQSRQNGETGTDRVTKDPVRSREKVEPSARARRRRAARGSGPSFGPRRRGMLFSRAKHLPQCPCETS